MQDSIILLENIVKKELSGLEGSAHSYNHTERVYNIAIHIAEQEKANLTTVKIAALLHDIGRAYGEPHHETAIEPAKKALTAINYPKEKQEEILNIVFNHRVSDRPNLNPLEGKIVWDADKLDLIGAIGISRAFHHAGESGISLEYAINWCKNRAKDNQFEFHTEAAKKIAEKRYTTMRLFIESLEEELLL